MSRSDLPVGVYCFPNYHVDARSEIVHGEGRNEWAEGSYLEPDAEDGMGYLEAVGGVFG